MKKHVISVSNLHYLINNNLNIKYPDLKVRGEVSQITKSSTGTTFFSLRDNYSSVNCVVFSNFSLLIGIKEGDLVIVDGLPNIYSVNGTFQLIVKRITEDGFGLHHENFILLREKLKLEGLFDLDKKKPLPQFISCIGIVTSINGAAIFDMMNTVCQKLQNVEVKVFPTIVQGINSVNSIKKSLKNAINDKDIDVIILSRGGGAAEDLWTFNDESLVRTISNSKKIIMTGIGHETDLTLADLAADFYAPTPTAVVERLVYEKNILINKVQVLTNTIRNLIENYIKNIENNFEILKFSLKSPQEEFFVNETRFNFLKHRMELLKTNITKKFLNDLFFSRQRLLSIDPEKILKRGYSVTYDSFYQKEITSFKEIKIGDELFLRFCYGGAKVKVLDIKKN